jgi:hypothetical protein
MKVSVVSSAAGSRLHVVSLLRVRWQSFEPQYKIMNTDWQKEIKCCVSLHSKLNSDNTQKHQCLKCSMGFYGDPCFKMYHTNITPNSTSETDIKCGLGAILTSRLLQYLFSLIYKNTKTVSQLKEFKLYPRADGIHFWCVFKHLHGTTKKEGSLELKNHFLTWLILQPIEEQKI